MFERLRELAVRDDVLEELKTALLEETYKLDQESKQYQENQPLQHKEV